MGKCDCPDWVICRLAEIFRLARLCLSSLRVLGNRPFAPEPQVVTRRFAKCARQPERHMGYALIGPFMRDYSQGHQYPDGNIRCHQPLRHTRHIGASTWQRQDRSCRADVRWPVWHRNEVTRVFL